MPIPYAVMYTSALSTFGQGATPSQQLIEAWKEHDNPNVITLNTVAATVAVVDALITNATKQQLVITCSVEAQGTGADLIVDMAIDGVTLFTSGPLSQGAGIGGATISYTLNAQTLVGNHSIELLAKQAGEGELTIPAHFGKLLVLVAAA